MEIKEFRIGNYANYKGKVIKFTSFYERCNLQKIKTTLF